jgi:hypothetical protein
LTFRLTVIDGSGASSFDTCIVNVTWVNVPPVAKAGQDVTVDEWTSVTLDASGSTDLDDGIATYTWKQISGPAVEVLNWDQPVITFTAPGVGSEGASLSFELTVVDHNGLKATDSCIVNVTWVNNPPLSNAGPDKTVFEGDTVKLDGSASSDDNGIVTYSWKQTVGTPVSFTCPTPSTLQFAAPVVAGSTESLTFSLTVTDTGGLQSEDTCQVNVNKKAGSDLTGSWAASAYDGTTFRGTLLASNIGNANAGTFKVAFYLSKDGTTPYKLIKTTTVYGLSGGATKNLSISYKNRSISGLYIIAVVDSGLAIQELDERNNEAMVKIQ